MDFDDILEELGEFGKYQALNYFLLCLPVFFGGANSLTYVFTAGIPKYRCFVPGCDNETAPHYSGDWVQEAIPADKSSGAYNPSLCSMFKVNSLFTNDSCPLGQFTSTETTCDKWVFDEGEWTILGEWNLTCLENEWMLSLVGTVHFAGILIGSIAAGFLADRFGRKQVLIISVLVMSATGIGQAVSPTYISFIVLAFLNAVGTAGVYPTAFIIGVELVGRKKREMSGIVLNYFYALGEAMVGVVALLVKDWVTLQLIISIPSATFVLYFWIIPESARWLIAKNLNTKAGKIIEKAAKVNGVILSEGLLASFKEGLQKQDTIEEDNNKTISECLKEIMKSKKLRTRSLLSFVMWAATACVYYGLSLNSTSLGGNKYVNFILVCLVEIPGYTLAWFAINKVGRRLSLIGSLFLCSATCVAVVFVPKDTVWAIILLFLLGKLGITAAFGTLYVYTAELYPTVMRSAGVGTSSMMARIGAMVAPFAPLLGQYVEPLPLLVFGAVSAFAGLLGFLLPETVGTRLPDTLEAAEKL